MSNIKCGTQGYNGSKCTEKEYPDCSDLGAGTELRQLVGSKGVPVPSSSSCYIPAGQQGIFDPSNAEGCLYNPKHKVKFYQIGRVFQEENQAKKNRMNKKHVDIFWAGPSAFSNGICRLPKKHGTKAWYIYKLPAGAPATSYTQESTSEKNWFDKKLDEYDQKFKQVEGGDVKDIAELFWKELAGFGGFVAFLIAVGAIRRGMKKRRIAKAEKRGRSAEDWELGGKKRGPAQVVSHKPGRASAPAMVPPVEAPRPSPIPAVPAAKPIPLTRISPPPPAPTVVETIPFEQPAVEPPVRPSPPPPEPSLGEQAPAASASMFDNVPGAKIQHDPADLTPRPDLPSSVMVAAPHKILIKALKRYDPEHAITPEDSKLRSLMEIYDLTMTEYTFKRGGLVAYKFLFAESKKLSLNDALDTLMKVSFEKATVVEPRYSFAEGTAGAESARAVEFDHILEALASIKGAKQEGAKIELIERAREYVAEFRVWSNDGGYDTFETRREAERANGDSNGNAAAAEAKPAEAPKKKINYEFSDRISLEDMQAQLDKNKAMARAAGEAISGSRAVIAKESDSFRIEDLEAKVAADNAEARAARKSALGIGNEKPTGEITMAPEAVPEEVVNAIKEADATADARRNSPWVSSGEAADVDPEGGVRFADPIHLRHTAPTMASLPQFKSPAYWRRVHEGIETYIKANSSLASSYDNPKGIADMADGLSARLDQFGKTQGDMAREFFNEAGVTRQGWMEAARMATNKVQGVRTPITIVEEPLLKNDLHPDFARERAMETIKADPELRDLFDVEKAELAELFVNACREVSGFQEMYLPERGSVVPRDALDAAKDLVERNSAGSGLRGARDGKSRELTRRVEVEKPKEEADLLKGWEDSFDFDPKKGKVK